MRAPLRWISTPGMAIILLLCGCQSSPQLPVATAIGATCQTLSGSCLILTSPPAGSTCSCPGLGIGTVVGNIRALSHCRIRPMSKLDRHRRAGPAPKASSAALNAERRRHAAVGRARSRPRHRLSCTGRSGRQPRSLSRALAGPRMGRMYRADARAGAFTSVAVSNPARATS